MSPSRPATIRSDAYASEYAVRVHWSWESDASRSSWIVGSATPRVVVGSDVTPLAIVTARRVAREAVRRSRMARPSHNLRWVSATRALLSGLIDHAPLFPPASLPLDEALDDHRRARSSPHSWMVGRFVCPASRLGDLDGEHLRMSVVADGEAVLDERVEAIEGRDLGLVKLGLETYLEDVPLEE